MLRPALRIVSAPRADPPLGVDDDERLVDALRAGRAWAERALLAQYTGHVRRVLARILGMSPDVDDLAQSVFLRSLDRIDDLREGVTVRAWLTSFAVNIAREALRRRARWRWLSFFAPDDLPDPASESADADTGGDARRAVRATYAILDRMDVDLRTAFALRHIDGMELEDVAVACGVSLATIKRRLAKADATFGARARRDPVLREWVEEGTRWRSK
jgi:RNA polymerase sigma-70 factor, ECF subfamily